MSIYLHSILRNVSNSRSVLLVLLLCSFFFSSKYIMAQQPQITRIAPSNITFRGISMADFTHSMVVGDSATILINLDSDNVAKGTGRTYTQLPVPVTRSHTVYGVSYYDSLHAIVIGDAGLILRTSDQGSSWKEISKGLTGSTLRGIAQISGGTFAIVGDGGLVMRSVDSGHTWNIINSGTTDTLFAVTFGSPRVGIAVGEKGTTLKTTDGGLNWQSVTGLGDQNLNFYAVAMSGEDSAIVVGDNSRIHYMNDGIHWHTAVRYNYQGQIIASNQVLGPLRAVAYTGLAPKKSSAWALAWGDNDLISAMNYPTAPKGDTSWTLGAITVGGDADGSSDIVSWRLECMTVNRSGSRLVILVAGENGRILQSTDSTGIGYKISTAVSDYYIPYNDLLFVSFDSFGNGYGTAPGTIIRSNNNGLTWQSVFHDFFLKVSGVHIFDSNTVVVAGWDGYIYRTIDGGQHWITEQNTLVQYKLHAFAFPTHDVGVCVGDQGTMIRTTDAGITWKDVGDHQIPQFLNSVAFSSPTIGVLIGQNGTIRRTTDAGLTWPETPPTPLDNYQSANLKYIDAFPDGTYYIGSDSGVIKSVDHGKNWYLIAAPPCYIGTSFYNSKIGLVGEYSTTKAIAPDVMVLKYTKDGGITWSNSFQVPIINNNRLTVHWLNDHTFLLYGTFAIDKIDLSGPNVVTQVISSRASPLRAYPNPNRGPSVTIDYTIENNGPVSIELVDELGSRVSTLYTGMETAGEHSRTLALPPDLHGNYIITLDANGKQQTLKVVKF